MKMKKKKKERKLYWYPECICSHKNAIKMTPRELVTNTVD